MAATTRPATSSLTCSPSAQAPTAQQHAEVAVSRSSLENCVHAPWPERKLVVDGMYTLTVSRVVGNQMTECKLMT